MSNLTPEQKALFAGKTWTLHTHLRMSNGSSYIYKCAELRIGKVVVNERKKGKYSSKSIFTIDGDDREFTDLASLADALIAKGVKARSA